MDAASARRVADTYDTDEARTERARTLELLRPRPGERVLVVGTGPGQLLDEVARAAGPGATGVDPDPVMVTLARRRCGTRAVVEQRALSGRGSLPDGPFDAVACLQVLEFVADVPAAVAELHRVLRPGGGRLLVLDTDWSSLHWPGPGQDRHRRVRDAWCTTVPRPRLPHQLGPLLARAGFTGEWTHRAPMRGPASTGYGAALREMVADAAPGRCGLTRAEVDAWAAGVAACGDDPFSLDRWFLGATRP
ncbi:methyltransferase domain-containing protein [Pseudonocardia spirodelae]|uniref:Methyltransferase domain-containing protein n=1 Tax=Pseudonocardia spirodelae TaxID=3133431 RepID=A0ABU8TAD4_9PSEU